MFIGGIAAVRPEDIAWYSTREGPDEKVYIPDILYTKLGLLIGTLLNFLIAGALYVLGISFGVFKSRNKDGTVKFESVDPSVLDYVLFYTAPIMFLLFSISYPIMCINRKAIIGASMNVVTGLFFLMFGFYLWKFDPVPMMIFMGYGCVQLYNSTRLFMLKESEKKYNYDN
jgi:hypothetical protein